MRQVGLAGLIAAAVLIAAGSTPPPAGGEAAAGIETATTTGDAERVDTIPITRHPGAGPRVALSLAAHELPTLRRGDRLRALGEVQVTNTCALIERRCIGRLYSFDPRVKAWLVAGASSRATHGPSARRISRRESLECGQRRPNRNHHCVLVIPNGGMTVRSPRRLPCPRARCHINLVVSAHHPSARAGNRLVIGADTPSGGVRRGKGRVSAAVIRAGVRPRVRKAASARRVSRRIPMDRSGGWTSVYSVRLSNLQRGDVLIARARQILDVGHLDNAVFDSSRIILAQGRHKVTSGPLARSAGAPRTFTEANGFNCTHGPSAYRTPCVSRKAGLTTVARTPVDRRGRPIPLYVNLISRGFLKEAQPKGGGAAHVLPGGGLRITRISGG